MERLKNRILEMYSLKQGFTYDLKGNAVFTGIAVAFIETQGCNINDIDTVLQFAYKNNTYIGGWFDYETDIFYLDCVRLFNTEEIKEAKEFAREQKQIAIFNITKGEEIRL